MWEILKGQKTQDSQAKNGRGKQKHGLDVEHWQYQIPVSSQSNRNAHVSLMGKHNDTATLKGSLVVSYKTRHILTIWSAAENVYPHKNLHMDISSSLIHNCQNLEANILH